MGQIGEVDDALQAIADGAAVATTTITVATPAELVQRRSLLVGALQNLCDHGVKLQPQCGTRVRVEVTAAFAAVLKGITTMFAVVDTDTNPLASTVAGAGVTDAVVDAPAEVMVQTVYFGGLGPEFLYELWPNLWLDCSSNLNRQIGYVRPSVCQSG